MSAIDSDYLGFGHDRIEIHVDRIRAIGIALFSILLGIAIALPPSVQPALSMGGPVTGATIVALGGAATLIATGTYILLRIGLWRGPAIVIDAFGIHDRRTGAVMTPWSAVRDLRPIDRHGRHIVLDLGNGEPQTCPEHPSNPIRLPVPQTESLTIIDTFFLRSNTGNRILDFAMPLAAMTPIDLSETPVSEKTLQSDARIARNKSISIWIFLLAAGLAPGLAALSFLL